MIEAGYHNTLNYTAQSHVRAVFYHSDLTGSALAETTEDNRRQRLRFRSWHRGTREMDLLMGSFADRYLPSFDPAQLNAYEDILTLADPDLYGYITGTNAVPSDHDSDVMRLLCAHRFAV